MHTVPLQETITPEDQAGVAEAVRRAHATRTPVYPIGGATSLDYGLPAKQPGIGLTMTGLNRIIDYPARDMTITFEAGITMEALARVLAGEGQRLPIDAPLAARATLGGVAATNTSGPRRYGCGTLRDYVIGIRAVDGRGVAFQGGGRVVKNVAGYDFCKLLIGSLGTVGVVTQMTLKLKPKPEHNELMACDVADTSQAEQLLAALVHCETTPSAIELLIGPAWQATAAAPRAPGALGSLVVGLEGTAAEVAWIERRLASEWQAQGTKSCRTLRGEEAATLWSQLCEFPAQGDSPLVIKASVRPSAISQFVTLVRRIDPQCSIQAHAGNGIAIVRFADFPAANITRILVGELQPAVARWDGSVVVLSCPSGELTRQAVWGGLGTAASLMEAIREQFDPLGILNPGRFVY